MPDTAKDRILALSQSDAAGLWERIGFTPNSRRTIGDGWGCPNHTKNGHRPASLYAGPDRTMLTCHDCKISGDIFAVAGKLWGTDFKETLSRLCGQLGIQPDEQEKPAPPVKLEIECVYDYRTPDGSDLFQVVRFKPKTFRQRHTDTSEPSGWRWGLTRKDGTEIRPVLYRLPELSEAQPGALVLIVEGEKDVETAIENGFRATCNPMGAGKAGLVDWTPLAGMQALIIADKDEAGRKHAADVQTRANDAGADVLGIVECQRGKDLTEHVQAGGTIEEITRIVQPGKPIKEISLCHIYSRKGIALGKDGLPSDRIGTGMKTFDSVTIGFGPGWLISIQGLQGAGKSTMTYQWALHAAKSGRRVTIATTEMTPEQIKEVLAVQIADVSRRRIVFGINDDEERRLRNAEKEIDELPLKIEDLNVESETLEKDLYNIIRGNELAIIDHVTYLGLSVSTAAKTDWKTVLALIKSIKKTARKTGVPTIAVGHLNRQAQAARSKGDNQGIEHSAGPFAIHQESDLSLILENKKGAENIDVRILSIQKGRFCPQGGRIRLAFHADKANLTDEGWDVEQERQASPEYNRSGDRGDY